MGRQDLLLGVYERQDALYPAVPADRQEGLQVSPAADGGHHEAPVGGVEGGRQGAAVGGGHHAAASQLFFEILHDPVAGAGAQDQDVDGIVHEWLTRCGS